jgi:PhoD-like phosphatase
MARLVIGPLLRYVGERDATVWVETDSPCEVTVLDASASTFQVEGHHYALVVIEGLEPGSTQDYEVLLDGERVWPDPGSPFPPSVIRTIAPGEPLTVVFGSCRVTVPHEPPYTLSKDDDPRGRELDALHALALRMRQQPTERWPQVLFLCGDQVYADEVSPGTLEFIRSRRDTSVAPGEEVADFQEYTRLYWDAWGDPSMRWLLSTVSSSMIFDDHDVHDDWNTSDVWVRQMRAKDWWDARIEGAFMSYWVYQHLGNLSPRSLAENELYRRVRQEQDAGDLLRRFAFEADREVAGKRWSYHRDLGRVRLLVMDSRAGRVLSPDRREMLDDDEWRWVEEQADGDFDHLLLGTTLPLLLAPGMHYLEAWSDRVADGAWGSLPARLAERMRQGLDLEHWAAFDDSFRRVTEMIARVGARDDAPASIVVLSGDVHHAYLAETAFRRSAGVRSAVYQAVCSPLRNPLDSHERRAIKFAMSRPAGAVMRALARTAGVRDHDIRWRLAHDAPWFDNQVATLELSGREAVLRIEKAEGDGVGDPWLEQVFERRLA